MMRKILVATDLSEASEPALRTAIELGARLGAQVTALYVSEPPYEPHHWFLPWPERDAELFRAALRREQDEARGRLRAQVGKLVEREQQVPLLKVLGGIPSDVILEAAAQTEADVIVMGTHGRRGLQHAVMGSIAERVVRTSPIAVLTVRAR